MPLNFTQWAFNFPLYPQWECMINKVSAVIELSDLHMKLYCWWRFRIRISVMPWERRRNICDCLTTQAAWEHFSQNVCAVCEFEIRSVTVAHASFSVSCTSAKMRLNQSPLSYSNTSWDTQTRKLVNTNALTRVRAQRHHTHSDVQVGGQNATQTLRGLAIQTWLKHRVSIEQHFERKRVSQSDSRAMQQ